MRLLFTPGAAFALTVATTVTLIAISPIGGIIAAHL